jgi:uncharacterized protein
MIFDIDRIVDDSLDFEVTVGKSHFKIEQTDCSLCQDVTVKGVLKRVEKSIFLTGSIATEVETFCSRCLETIHIPVQTEVTAKYVEPAELEDEYELHESDIDTEYYSENKVDITHTVHDQILLAIPMVCLCKEDCQGLCSECGKNLNLGLCVCSKKEAIDPRFAELLKLKDKLGK